MEEAIRIGRCLERYDLRRLEEPVWPPEDYAGLARVRQAVRIPIATGENDATVFGMREIIAAGTADIADPDPDTLRRYAYSPERARPFYPT